MTVEQLSADYLVIGSGAMGMAFTDVLVTESEASVIMVDRCDRPGGHWNVAYPFVRLHQPSSFYGVNSLKLGLDRIDDDGWNEGLYELASGTEVVTYFEQVMQRQFLPSGQVRHFPMCDYKGEGRFVSTVSGTEYQVNATRTVDATYMNVKVPSTTGPLFEVGEGAQCIPPNELPGISHPADGYVVVGAGKTGMDACLWLLRNRVDPDDIAWIMPRDSWLLDRAAIQPGQLARRQQTAVVEPASPPGSVTELFEQAEQAGGLMRLDPAVRPGMYRCATVTRKELAALRRITNIVRKGHVLRLEPDRILMEGGEMRTSPARVHINCTADGLAKRPAVPVFADDGITLQAVRTCQQVFSAAFIGHVELAYEGEESKNRLCTPVPHPDTDLDWLRVSIATGRNQLAWAEHPELITWLQQSRLDGFSEAPSEVPSTYVDPPGSEALAALLAAQRKALDDQQRLLDAALAAQ